MKNFTVIRSTIFFVFGMIFSSSLAWATPEPMFIERSGERIIQPDQARTIHIGNVVTITIPLNAVDEPTLIQYTVSFWRHTDDPQLMIEFYPEGLVFNVPVEINVKMKNSAFESGDQIIMYYFNETLNEWEHEDEFVVDDPSADYFLSMDHFSLYAFTKIRNGDEE